MFYFRLIGNLGKIIVLMGKMYTYWQEFIVQMLFHSSDQIRQWTYTFFTVLYTSKYLEKPDDPQVTLIFVNHLYTSRTRCEQHADISEFYFTFLHDLLDEIWSQANLINGFTRIKEIIGWLENRVAQKEANDHLLKGTRGKYCHQKKYKTSFKTNDYKSHGSKNLYP